MLNSHQNLLYKTSLNVIILLLFEKIKVKILLSLKTQKGDGCNKKSLFPNVLISTVFFSLFISSYLKYTLFILRRIVISSEIKKNILT